MKISIRFFSFILLILFFSITATAFQQEPEIIAKGILRDTTDYSFAKLQKLDSAAKQDTTIKVVAVKVIDTDTSFNHIESRYRAAFDRLKPKAASIKEYAKANNYSSEYVFLVDMSIPSGKNRFFVYNLKADSLVCSSLVSHGFGSTIKTSEDQLIFSNNDYSFKTSLGKYKIGTSYNGAYGLAYKLYGLDSTNSKAFQRAIVLHSDVHVPTKETYPYKIFQSAGCPTVAPSFLPILGNYIKASPKPILMWIYN